MQRTNSRLASPSSPPRWLRVWLLTLCGGLLLSACGGGSGSSGFDISLAENRAIDRALADQGCEVLDGLTICASTSAPVLPTATRTVERTATATVIPATPTATRQALPTGSATPTSFSGMRTATPQTQPTGSVTATAFRATATTTRDVPQTATPTSTQESVPSGTATPTLFAPSTTPTPTAVPVKPGVDIAVATDAAIPCVQEAPGGPCRFVLSFESRGFPPDAAYRVALRQRDPDERWSIVPATDADAALSASPAGGRYQIAVLVYLEAPSFVPDEVEVLADSGADFAFVTPVLSVGSP
ncbi:MAG: hypothetical protein ABI629_09695 [bacterium]